MTTNIDRAAEVIYRVLNPRFGDFGGHESAARSLADAGLITPDLPTPDRHNHRGEPIWETEGHTTVSNTGPLPINLAGPFGEGWSMYPIEARDIADALNAAANHAEVVGRADA